MHPQIEINKKILVKIALISVFLLYSCQ